MNTYTFTFLNWIPGYDDFDQDWVDIEANDYAEAVLLLHKSNRARFAKSEPALYAVNGKVVETSEYH